jgi:hypothetical protein
MCILGGNEASFDLLQALDLDQDAVNFVEHMGVEALR